MQTVAGLCEMLKQLPHMCVIFISNFHMTGGLSDVRKLCNKHIPAYKFDFVSPELKQKFEPDQVAKDLDIQYIADKSVVQVSLYSLI